MANNEKDFIRVPIDKKEFVRKVKLLGQSDYSSEDFRQGVGQLYDETSLENIDERSLESINSKLDKLIKITEQGKEQKKKEAKRKSDIKKAKKKKK